MSEICITSYGHSCFEISYEGNSVLLDPYEEDSVPGLSLPKNIQVDAVYCSHDHRDHNAAHLVHQTGNNPFPLFRASVPHDDCGGRKRGFTAITFLKVGKITIVHMGDIGREPTDEEYEALQRADVVLMPVGGYFTVDGELAAKILQKIHAKLNILMHYRTGNIGYAEIADLQDIRKYFPGLKNLGETNITFDEEKVPEEYITLKAEQK